MDAGQPADGGEIRDLRIERIDRASAETKYAVNAGPVEP
jgi:hypothetical protein